MCEEKETVAQCDTGYGFGNASQNTQKGRVPLCDLRQERLALDVREESKQFQE